ncbi:Conserved_hypothetical protein [Hexamita inflata]|uniref:Uncharacterized protein n=1 Tax=Hexamita inflata TaxID=28002 RepID=A0AA86QLM6_9EUKA|nr:Conserved hypothetical protein [Hexamita inflata]
MPQTKIDCEKAMHIIAQYVSRITQIDVSTLLSDRKKLDSIVESISKFDWDTIARQMGLTRQQMYRWYYDTYQRNLYGSVSQNDIAIIKDCLKQAISMNQNIGADFQKDLKLKLSKEYQRNSFTVAFNNSKRLVMSQLKHASMCSNDTISHVSQESFTAQNTVVKNTNTVQINNNIVDLFHFEENQDNIFLFNIFE